HECDFRRRTEWVKGKRVRRLAQDHPAEQRDHRARVVVLLAGLVSAGHARGDDAENLRAADLRCLSPQRRSSAGGYFFSEAVQFCTRVRGAISACSTGVLTRKRLPSAETSYRLPLITFNFTGNRTRGVSAVNSSPWTEKSTAISLKS